MIHFYDAKDENKVFKLISFAFKLLATVILSTASSDKEYEYHRNKEFYYLKFQT